MYPTYLRNKPLSDYYVFGEYKQIIKVPNILGIIRVICYSIRFKNDFVTFFLLQSLCGCILKPRVQFMRFIWFLHSFRSFWSCAFVHKRHIHEVYFEVQFNVLK